MSVPSACTYLPPRKNTCVHPCKVVTRRNKPQCRTKYFRKKKKKGRKGKKTRRRSRSAAVEQEAQTQEEAPTQTQETPPIDSTTTVSSDPLKSMVNLISKRVSLLQQQPV